MVLEGLPGAAGGPAGGAVQLDAGGLAVGVHVPIPSEGARREQLPVMETQPLSLPHGHLHGAVVALAPGRPLPAQPPAPHRPEEGQRLAVRKTWPHLHAVRLPAALVLTWERREGQAPCLGQQPREPTGLRRGGRRWKQGEQSCRKRPPTPRGWPRPGAQLTPGPAAPHPGLQPQTAAQCSRSKVQTSASSGLLAKGRWLGWRRQPSPGCRSGRPGRVSRGIVGGRSASHRTLLLAAGFRRASGISWGSCAPPCSGGRSFPSSRWVQRKQHRTQVHLGAQAGQR